MTKNISLPRLVKAANKRISYQISENKLYIADKQGTFVVAIPFAGTDEDKQDLENLKTRCSSFDCRDDLARLFDINFHENIDDCVPAEPTGICYTDETGKTVTWLTGGRPVRTKSSQGKQGQAGRLLGLQSLYPRTDRSDPSFQLHIHGARVSGTDDRRRRAE